MEAIFTSVGAGLLTFLKWGRSAEYIHSYAVGGLSCAKECIYSHSFAALQVWLAKCKAMDKEVAVKLMDLEDLNCKLARILSQHIHCA